MRTSCAVADIFNLSHSLSRTQRREAEAHCQCYQAPEPKAGCLTPRPVRRCSLPIYLQPAFCPCPLDTRVNHLKHLRKPPSGSLRQATPHYVRPHPFLLCPNPEHDLILFHLYFLPFLLLFSYFLCYFQHLFTYSLGLGRERVR